jgi:hypothetical protein
VTDGVHPRGALLDGVTGAEHERDLCRDASAKVNGYAAVDQTDENDAHA